MAEQNPAGNWCLIESDPGVFTELIREFGVKGVQVEELYSLDDDSRTKYNPVYGLIFLFKWRHTDDPEGELALDAPGVYFAQQVITNACASQAIINLLLNTNDPENVTLGETLEEFHSFTSSFDPQVHNSFAREHYMELDIPKHAPHEDNFHFISYVPVAGHVYELDGMREAPVNVGPVADGQDWFEVVKPYIQKRIEKYQSDEIHFNLMAVVPDMKARYENRLAQLIEGGMDSEEVNDEIATVQSMISEEEEKMKRYKLENNRRRHNYIPFIVELLKILAREGQLVPLVREALQKESDRKKKKAKTELKNQA